MTILKRAEQDAGEALRIYGATALSHFPVDANAIATFFGVEVYLDDLEKRCDGVVMHYSNSRQEITLNSNNPLTRRRFTCAHALGHLWQHQDATQDIGFVEDPGDVEEGTFINDHELYANAFAMALLMPEHLVRPLAQGFNVTELANFFKVSPLALTTRLRMLGC